jgi:hypothetical protein
MPDENNRLSPEHTAERVHFGSSEPEWFLYLNGIHTGYWYEYHDGPLPKRYAVSSERRTCIEGRSAGSGHA